jgi:hypothetical protein
MSSLLSFDLIKMEQKLRNEVSEKFGETVWDSKELVGSDSYEMDHSSWRKMMSVGHTPTTRSTRRCLDNKRYHDRIVGNSGWAGVRL